jgi:hypothetical protein
MTSFTSAKAAAQKRIHHNIVDKEIGESFALNSSTFIASNYV